MMTEQKGGGGLWRGWLVTLYFIRLNAYFLNFVI
jgi:hypothetical protein